MAISFHTFVADPRKCWSNTHSRVRPPVSQHIYTISEMMSMLGSRYREVPTFGRDTIRKFSKNCSALKQMTAREYEDLLQVSATHLLTEYSFTEVLFLQCAIPVFDGLLPEPHNSRLMDVLFLFAYWHGMAKLRVHIDPTLKTLDGLTHIFGNRLREFATKIALDYKTQELQKEVDARNRRHTKQRNKAKTKVGGDSATSIPILTTEEPQARTGAKESTVGDRGRKMKHLNLNTYKYHAMGDVTSTIRRYGTTDSYSTEPVCCRYFTASETKPLSQGELEHRTPKSRYMRTSKKQFLKQLTQIERRQARIRRIRARLSAIGKPTQTNLEFGSSPDARYHISKSQNERESIPFFLQQNAGDPAVRVRKLASALFAS
jgi:hypothetical protein